MSGAMLDRRAALAMLRARVKAAGNQRDAAKALGISQQYLSDVLSGARPVSDRLLRRLGLRKVITYQPL